MIHPAPVPAPIVCAIMEQRTGRTIQLGIEIRARTDQSGTYRFQIIKRGPAGESRVSQEAKFSVAAQRDLQLHGLTLSMEPDAHYHAVLSVTIGPAVYRCERDGPEEAQVP